MQGSRLLVIHRRAMPDATRTRSPASAREGLVSKALTGLSRILKWLVFSLVLSIVCEWVGMVYWWPEQGLSHSRRMLEYEIRFLEREVPYSLLVSHPPDFARAAADTGFYYLFEVTGWTAFMQWALAVPEAGERGWRVALHRVVRPVAHFILAAMQVVQLFMARLAVLCLATPVFVLFALVALVDGLVMRDLRRWGGGRESSFVYHHARKAITPLLMIPWVVYLALPFSLHPAWIVLPAAALAGLALAVTAHTFKKYL